MVERVCHPLKASNSAETVRDGNPLEDLQVYELIHSHTMAVTAAAVEDQSKWVLQEASFVNGSQQYEVDKETLQLQSAETGSLKLVAGADTGLVAAKYLMHLDCLVGGEGKVEEVAGKAETENLQQKGCADGTLWDAQVAAENSQAEMPR